MSDKPRELWVSCDEAGIDGKARYYGFGSLWMLDAKRGEYLKLIRAVRQRHRFRDEGEFKWEKVRKQKLPFYKDVVDTFFKTNWLAFHSIVVRKGWVDKRRPLEDAMLVHLHTFIVNKVQKCRDKTPGRPHRFRFWVDDPLPHRYQKAD